MAESIFSWYSAKQVRFDSSELGIESEVASLTGIGSKLPSQALPTIQPALAALFLDSRIPPGADVERLTRTDKRYALAVQFES